MLDIFKFKARGSVTFRIGRTERVILRMKNTISGQAKEITTKRLIAHPTSTIDRINLFQAGALVHSAPITATSILATQQVQFDANILEAAFNGIFDEARLTATGIGPYAILTGLNINKSSTEPLLISWKIKII